MGRSLRAALLVFGAFVQNLPDQPLTLAVPGAVAQAASPAPAVRHRPYAPPARAGGGGVRQHQSDEFDQYVRHPGGGRQFGAEHQRHDGLVRAVVPVSRRRRGELHGELHGHHADLRTGDRAGNHAGDLQLLRAGLFGRDDQTQEVSPYTLSLAISITLSSELKCSITQDTGPNISSLAIFMFCVT